MGQRSENTFYAIVDIETTGGYAAGSGITEVAIRIHDGTKVVERYDSLVNPQRPIPLYIQAVTGISPEMVADSPTFNELAPQIFELLKESVFVAHNVNFDYSFLKYHLELAGFSLTSPKLCTVRLSRKIRPGLPSYSLGRLCNALGIPINNRHRAGGDADATAILFGNLVEWDVDGHLTEMLKRKSKHQQLPPNLAKDQFDVLPESTGVYYFKDLGGKIIYVGKANNIRSRVAQHFSGHNPNPQRQHFLRHIHSIDYERCGTELMALLLEAAEIKRYWPAYNRSLKRFEPKYALYTYEDNAGYLRLAIGKHSRNNHNTHLFHNQLDAINLLNLLISKFALHPQYCTFGGPRQLSGKPAALAPEDHNQRVNQALDYLANELPTFAIFDRGRDETEVSCIWVENGKLHGMGHISHSADISGPEEIKEMLTPCLSNGYMMQLIFNYAQRYPLKVWKPGADIAKLYGSK
ncbi:exonuclease domain-containing protein [Parapedobacter sp. GCM10030251]|uniref:exonuclease domain-containing protein n=1 Tax=Parapedobacter sp. GCM10030251 TaxID=3273419 RepID=UPI0036103130